MKNLILALIATMLLSVGISHADFLAEKLGGEEIKVPIPSDYYRYDGKSEVIDTYYRGLSEKNRIVAMFCNEKDLILVLKDTMPSLDRSYSVQVSKSYESLKIGDYVFSQIISDIEKNLTPLLEDSENVSNEMARKSSSGFSELLKAQVESKLTGVTNLGFFDKRKDSICTLSLGRFQVAEKDSGLLIDRVNVIALCVINLDGKVLNLMCVSKCQSDDDALWVKSEIKKWRDDFILNNPIKPPLATSNDEETAKDTNRREINNLKSERIWPSAISAIVIAILIAMGILAAKWLFRLLGARR